MNVKYILLLTFLTHFNDLCSPFEHNIYVSNSTGNNTLDCVTNSSLYTCKTLDYVFGKISNTFEVVQLRTSIKIQVRGDQFLQENYDLSGLNYFGLSGDAEGSVIKCKSTRGLIILSSTDIVIEHLTFLNCGSLQRNQNNKDIQFQAGLFFSNITNIKVTDCVITNSSGIGVALLNVGGHVIFNHTHFTGNINNSRNGSKIASGLAKVGGGLILEFTYNDTANVQFSSHNTYIFYNCTFIKNGCRWNKRHEPEPTEADTYQHVIFGCGGGMAMSFKGQTHSNIIRLEYCNFTSNLADWGGGYYFLFEDRSLSNFVHLKHVTAESNHGVLSGGAGRFMFRPYITNTNDLQPNYFRQEHCSYLNNFAAWGGGVSVFGSSVYKANRKTDTNLSFINSHLVNNQAVVGSALGFLSNPLDLQDSHRHNLVFAGEIGELLC